MTSGKILVQEAIYERLKARVTEKTRQLVVGNPAQENVTIGPLIDEKQCRRVADLVQAAVTHGARLETGGDAQGVFSGRRCSRACRRTILCFTKKSSARWLC